jgi:hypothetical protein
MNRYTQLPVAMYNPMSFQELAFAPSYLRDRHDAVEGQLGALTKAANQYNVHDLDAEAASQLVNPLQENITQLGTRLATEGVNASRAIPEALKLKGQYSQMFSPQGAIGQLQNRALKLQEYQKQLQEQFKNNPEFVRSAMAQSKITGSIVGPDGKLKLGEFNPYQTVRHIADEEIMDQLNKAAAMLKPTDLGELGIGKQKVDNFYDLYTAADAKGITPDRIFKIMDSNLGPEARASIIQAAELGQGIPRTSMTKVGEGENAVEIPTAIANFMQRISASANQLANVDVSRQRFMKDNVLAKQALSEQNNIPMWVNDFLDGVGVQISDLTHLQMMEVNDLVKVQTNPQNYIVKGQDGKDKIRVDQNGNPISKNDFNKIGQNASIKLVDYDPNFQSEVKQNLTSINPQFARLSSKEVAQRVNNYKQQVSSHKVEVVSPVGENLNGLQDRIVGSKNKTGMIFNRQITLSDGVTVNSDEALKRMGFNSIDEFYEKGAPAVRGYVPEQGAYAIAIKDPKNNKNIKFAYVEADPALKEKTANTMLMSTLGRTGATFQATDIPFRFEGDNTPYRKYYVNDLSNGVNSGKLIIAPWGNQNGEPLSVNELYKNGKLIPGATEISFSEVAQTEKMGFKTSSNSIALFGK